MARILALGSSGPDVMDVQTSLNARPPTRLPLLKVDGAFGLKTQARVQEFQRNNNLKPDGSVGPLTAAKLVTRGQTPSQLVFCGDSLAANARGQNVRFAATQPQRLVGAPVGGFPSLLPSLPKVRQLTGSEIAVARGAFGSSLDFSTVFITDQTGQNNRAFVMAVPAPFGAGALQIMNLGPAPDPKTFVHELTHVWQSQHHGDPFAYMSNCVGSQKLAELLGGANSAYAYIPGKPFGEYAGEQIAQQVMRGEAPIVAHVKSMGVRSVDPDNVSSLKSFRFEDASKPGVKI